MKRVRAVALSRHRAPPFAAIAGLELLQLRKLPDLAFRLFVELVALSDFATGFIATTFPQLIGLLDFDQAPCAHKVPKPTKRRLEHAVQVLLDLDLVKRAEPPATATRKALFFQLRPRSWIHAADAMRVPMSAPSRKPAKQAPARASEIRRGDEGADEGARDQHLNTTPLPPSLSTAAKPSRHVRDVLADVQAKLKHNGRAASP
jgi:hypothetical protein